MKRPLAPYLPPADPNAPADPVAAMRDRQNAAIAARVGQTFRASVEAAGVDGAATPPKPKTTPKTPEPTSKTGSPPASSEPSTKDSSAPASSSTPKPSDEPAKDGSESSGSATPAAPKGPRYDFKSVKKWAEEHPEEAAELRPIFGADQNTSEEWIKVQNKRRKMKEEVRSEKEKGLAEAAAERAQAKADRELAEGAAGQLRPLMDMWAAAVRKDAQGNIIPDFDTLDHAFEMTAQMPLDQYMRLRARRGVANPESARQRAEIVRLQRELEAAKGGAAGAVAPQTQALALPPPAPVATPAAPVDLKAKWDDELPKGHKLRQLADWPAKLEAAMDKFHDAELDEYSRDPEDVANALLKRELAAFSEEEEPATPPVKRAATKPSTPRARAAAVAPSPAPKTPKNGLISVSPEEFEGNMQERERWALERARMRLRGELE